MYSLKLDTFKNLKTCLEKKLLTKDMYFNPGGGRLPYDSIRRRATLEDYVFHCFSIFEVFIGLYFSIFGISRVLLSKFWYFLVFLGSKYSSSGIHVYRDDIEIHSY